MIKRLVAGLIGIGLGILGSRYLFVGSALSLIPWGVIGLLIGAWNWQSREALVDGAIYGFLLAFTFMLSGYQGTAPWLSRIPFFAILGLVGAFCGMALAWVGCRLGVRLSPRER